MADQTPDPIEVIAGWLWRGDMDGLLGESARSASGELLDALTAAGLQIVPIVDDSTRQEVEALIEAIKAMRPDPSEPCPPGWDADDREGDRNVYRSAELLAAAYLPPPRLTDASYSGRTYK